MKIYVSCDMEGTAAVCSWQQVDARNPTPDYAIYRRYMTQEMLAALDGARSGGATDFLINDSHGPMRNLLLDDLPEDIRVIFGNRKPFSMVQDLDATFNGVFFTGYHGGIGRQDATLCHTYAPSVVYNVRINGMLCSEATLNAALAGYHGVPVLLITGDRATIADAKEQMPWITGVAVKDSIGNYSVNSLTPRAACAAIAAGAREAMQRIPDAKPFVFSSPIVLEIDLAKVEQADWIEMIPGFERTGGRAVRFTHDDYAAVFKAFVTAFRLGASAGEPA